MQKRRLLSWVFFCSWVPRRRHAGKNFLSYHRYRRHHRRLLSDGRRHCQYGQRKKDQYGIRATVEATGGSVFNINAVVAGDLEFGIAQSDRQFQAYNGLAEWQEKGAQKDLRAVFTIYPELVTLVAAVDANIETIADLKGKRVNLGDPGSGNRQNAIDALETAGLNYEKDLKAESVKASEAPALLAG